MVTFKVISPVSGDIQRTSSMKSFRSNGMEFSVRENLAPGEEPKYEKAMAKKAGGPVIPVVKPEIIEKVPQEQEVIVKVPEKKIVKTPIKSKKQVKKQVAPIETPQVKPLIPQKNEGREWWF